MLNVELPCCWRKAEARERRCICATTGVASSDVDHDDDRGTMNSVVMEVNITLLV